MISERIFCWIFFKNNLLPECRTPLLLRQLPADGAVPFVPKRARPLQRFVGADKHVAMTLQQRALLGSYRVGAAPTVYFLWQRSTKCVSKHVQPFRHNESCIVNINSRK